MSPIRLYFAGTENNEWRTFLGEQGVEYVSMSYVGLTKRGVKFVRPWLVAEKFPEGQHVLLDAGGYSFNKADAEVTEEQAMDMANAYMAFVTANIDRVDLVTEFDANILGRDWLLAMREDFYDGLDDKFCPVWHDDTGIDALEQLASRYAHVGILAAGLDEHTAPILNALVSRYGVKLHGLGITTTKVDLAQSVRWDSIGSKSWLSPSIDGDTIIWTGQKLQRYPKRLKDQSRKRHRSYIEQQGFDAQKIIDDDRKEILRLSVWSWQQYMASLDRARVMNPFGAGPVGVTPQPGNPDGENAERGGDPVTPQGPPPENSRLLPVVPTRRDPVLLPVMGIEIITGTGEGEEETEERLITTPSRSLLQCNTCAIREHCVKAQPGAECAYEIPVQVTSKNQMKRLQDALIEAQYQRAARMIMFEQVQGGYADANTSAEIDRLQKLINAKRDSEKSGFSLHMDVHDDKGVGVMSRMFGHEAGDAMTALPAPVQAADLMDNAIDAEIISYVPDSPEE